MPGPNVLDHSVRTSVIGEIRGEENVSRKRGMQRRFDVYRDRQDRYIIEKLENEFGSKSAQDMRKILSINLAKRIIDEKSSVYAGEPQREFANANDRELEQLENLYRLSMADSKLHLTNKYYNLFDQTAIQVMPKEGKIKLRPLGPHQYDVIPDSLNPEKPYAYILNVWDFDLHKSFRDSQLDDDYNFNDRYNQTIGDENDREGAQSKYVWWTDEWHFVTNGNGDLMTEVMPNPIGRLPFIDVSMEKDFQFFVRRGSSVVEFSLEWATCLSDLANINRLQGYAQGVVTSVKEPTGLQVGPQHLIWLQQDKNNPETVPTFQFVSPSPDLGGALSILETKLRVFLAAEGVDPSTISTGGESRSFSSGIERLLAMLDKFEASRQDMALFNHVEDELLELFIAWSNAFQGVAPDERLVDELNISSLNENIKVDVKFHQPMAIQSESEKLENIAKRLDLGLITDIEAIMEDRDVTEEVAIEIKAKIDEAKQFEMPQIVPFGGVQFGEDEGTGDREDSGGEEQREAEGEAQ